MYLCQINLVLKESKKLTSEYSQLTVVKPGYRKIMVLEY
jgi:hypothetical protein